MSNDPKAIVLRLSRFMTEEEIAAELRRDGVEVTQPTINRIKNGTVGRTGFDIGMGLVRLDKRVAQRA